MTLPDFLIDHPDGDVRLVGSRISIEDIARAFRDGYSAEMILGLFPSLTLLNVYKAIVFYLENREVVDAMVAETDRSSAEMRANHKPMLDLAEMRRRLEARAQLSTRGGS